MTASDCRSLFSCQCPLCHPSVILDVLFFVFVCHPNAPPLSSSPFPPLSSSTLVIEDPGFFPFCFCLSSSPSVILAPILSSSTLVIEDPVSLSFPSHMPQQPRLDSCFRRNDRRGAGMMTASDCRSLFSCQYPSCPALSSSTPFSVILDISNRGSRVLSFCFCLSSSPPPPLSSSPSPPSVILDISNRGSSVVAFSFSHATTTKTGFLLSQE